MIVLSGWVSHPENQAPRVGDNFVVKNVKIGTYDHNWQCLVSFIEMDSSVMDKDMLEAMRGCVFSEKIRLEALQAEWHWEARQKQIDLFDAALAWIADRQESK